MTIAVKRDSLISVPDLAQKALAATVSLEVQSANGRMRGRGSGFYVRRDLIATNLHVIQGARQGLARLVNTESTFRIDGITATDETNDLALLKVSVDGRNPLDLGDSDTVQIGETVYVAGNPKGFEGTFSNGIISARRDIDGKTRLQMTAPISPGSSGGPVLTREGEVIGVSASVYHPQDAQNLNFAIPSNALKALLAKGDEGEPSWDSRGFISAATYVQRGNAKLAARDFMGATKDFTQAVRQESANPLYYWYRGFAKGELGQHYAAIADYNKALRLNPEYAIAYHNRGYEKAQLGKYDDAIADYDEAIRLDPNYALAYLNRGVARRDLAQYAAAIADYDEAIRLKPDDASTYVNRGVAKRNLGQYAAAIADYDEAIRLKASYTVAFNNRGYAKSQLGDYESAVSDYDETIHRKPNYTVAYINRGHANRELRQYNAAISDYDDAIRLKPKDALIYYYRGIAKRELERFSDAEQDLRTALDLALRAGNHSVQAYINAVLG